MTKAIQGAALLAGAVGMGAAAFLDPALLATPGFLNTMESLVVGGIAMEAGAIADALLNNRGIGITTRQAAAFRQIVYGQQRLGGIEIYRSTTGSENDQYNWIIVVAGHEVDSLVNLYLDGRQVFWAASGAGYTVRNGIGFGGIALNATEIGPGGKHYNFGGTGHSGLYCEARFGDQTAGDYITALTANDPNWGPDGLGNTPYCGGCAIFYLKVEYDPNLFPAEPEIRITVNGKNNIYDPRTGLYGFTNNWALVVADVLTDPVFGLGDVGSVNTAQLVAAANVCDEQVDIAIGGTESRYCCDWHYDTGAGPGDILQTMMPAAAGRLSRIGGEWYIWPAYWQGPSFTWDQSILTDTVQWVPYRSFRELINRVNGTYIAPTYPWNVAGNLYDSNGWYNGTIQNNFPFAWQPTNYPQYAADVLHGYAFDAFLEEDSGVLGNWAGGTTYALGDAVSYGGALYQSRANANTGNTPGVPALSSGWSLYSGNPPESSDWVSTTSYNSGDVVSYDGGIYQSTESGNLNNPPVTAEWWLPWSGNQLPLELVQNCVLSVAQAQRVAKITLLRNRQQGSGTIKAHLAAWQMQPLDVMQFTFPTMSWTSKQLEITSCKLSVEPAKQQGDAPTVRATFGIQETDESTYEWSTTEELTVYDVPGNPPNPTTDVATALQATYTNNPQFALTQPTATTIDLAAVAVSFGGLPAVNYDARSFTIAAPSAPTVYYVTVADPNQLGDSSPELAATCQESDALVGVSGNTYMGAILALPGGGAVAVGPGGWPAPQSFQVVS